MNIKVCGITQLKQLQQLDGLNIDFAGLIFYKESPRYVVGKISKEELQSTDFDIKKVGVFVNAGYDEIMQTAEDYGLDVVQLHGEETPEAEPAAQCGRWNRRQDAATAHFEGRHLERGRQES
jgi:phosphoribosylanthranilate isomerase